MSLDAFSQLPPTRVQFTDEALGWKQAVRLAGQPMVDEGLVEESYVEAAIAIAEEKGPFYDLGKGIAMPHARPESGAHGIGLSYLRCRQPVNLLDREDHPIEIFLMLAATDKSTHIDMLRSLATVLINDELVARLKNATTPEDVISVFTS